MKKKTIEWWSYWSPRTGVWWPECRHNTKKDLKLSLSKGRHPDIALKGVKITKEDI